MWITSKEALQEFHEALTRVRVEGPSAPPERPAPRPTARTRTAEQEERAKEWVRRWKERTGRQ